MLVFVQRAFERVDVARQDADTSLFMNLMYAGEFVMKIATLALIAAIEDDSDRHRYRLLYKLVRADGLGEWSAAIDEIVTGPAAQHLLDEAQGERQELTERSLPGTWQYDCAARIDECLRRVDSAREQFPFRSDLRRWFALFCELRNKTKAHGATSPTTCSAICGPLEESLRLFASNFSLFKREWAYLHRNLSGKYRVTRVSEMAASFDPLKNSATATKWGSLPDGMHVTYDRPRYVELLSSDPELTDFFVPNGAFTNKKFEMLSLLTDTRKVVEVTPYLSPAGDLPQSETQGLGLLDVQGSVFANLPQLTAAYVSRPALEAQLESRLLYVYRDPVVTLVGRGGIGKTSTALTVLHKMSNLDRFGAIFWFSARDIDLLPEGPKLVRPHLLTEGDIAKEFVRLLQPAEANTKGFRPIEHLSNCLTGTPLGFPMLFVVDNFETAKNPQELFTWIDTYVRLPNKVLITSRSRDFKGDYPVEVFGMSESESDQLIDLTAEQLSIKRLVTEEFKKELFRESDGHPYVIKMLLGEVAMSGKTARVERIVASKGEVLDALFERTYSSLSPSAKQIFLTLCNWRSVVPTIAIEAVTLRTANEHLDVEAALDELRKASFIEITESEHDDGAFISIPLVATVFGKRKLDVSPMKSAVAANVAFLQYFGAAQKSDIRHGIGPRLERFFRRVADEVSKRPESLNEYVAILEFLARRYPRGWWLLADLYEEAEQDASYPKTKECLSRFLEADVAVGERRDAWERMSRLCRRTSDGLGEIHALVELCSVPSIEFPAISNAVNRWNQVFRQQFLPIATDERVILGTRLLNLAEVRIDEGNATDFSRVAWLALNLHDNIRAKKFTQEGLTLDPSNEYCTKLAQKLGLQPDLTQTSSPDGFEVADS